MNKNLIKHLCSAFLVVLSLALAVGVAFVPEKSLLFLSVLLLNFILCVVLKDYFSRTALIIMRTLLGLLFIFSGFTKGVDPLGTQYQMIDYLKAYNLPGLQPLALTGAFIMIAAEFVLGMLLLFNVAMKWTSLFTVLLMAFMTFLTFGDAFYNTVPDCGCFGKALLISNWQTFYKNIIIDTFVIVLFLERFRIKNTFKPKIEWTIFGLSVLLFGAFEAYNYRYLPVIDFMDWKEGVRLYPENPKPVEYYISYKNKTTGEVKEFLSKDIPTDAAFAEAYEYADMRTVDPNPKSIEIPILDKSLDEEGHEIVNDVTRHILRHEGTTLLVVAYNLDKTDADAWKTILEYQKQADANGIAFYCLTASEPVRVAEFQKEMHVDHLPFLYSDDTSLKALVRSNPGLILIKDGTVVKKWPHRRLPAYDQIPF